MFHQPPTLHRLFFALLPPVQLARRIAAAAGWFEDGRGAVDAGRLHMTLFILDDLPAPTVGLVERLRAVGADLDAAPVAVTLDRACGGERSVALRPSHRQAGLADLRRRIEAGARAHGIAERAGYRFAPHLTLGYRQGSRFSQPVAPVGWRADEVVLIDSHVGRTRHAVLGRWPLVARPDPQPLLL